MKKILNKLPTNAFSLAFLVLSIGFFYSILNSCSLNSKYDLKFQEYNNRLIASTLNDDSCSSLIASIIQNNPLSHDLNHEAKLNQNKIVTMLNGLTLKSKITFYKRLVGLVKNNSSFINQLSDHLNLAIQNAVLSPSEVAHIIKQVNIPELQEKIVIKNKLVQYQFENIAHNGLTYNQILQDMTSNISSRILQEKYYNSFSELNLHADDLLLIKTHFPNGLPSHKTEAQNLIEYLHFLSYLFPRERVQGFNEIYQVINSYDGPKSKQVLRYLNLRSKVDSYYLKQYSASIDEFKLKQSDQSTNDFIKSAEEISLRKKKYYQNLLFACTSKTPNRYNSAAGKQFTYLLVGINSIITTGSFLRFYEGTWDIEAFQRIGWDVGIAIVVGSIMGKILSTYSDSFLAKWYKSYFFYTSEDSLLYGDVILSGGVYGLLFGVDQNEAIERINQVLKLPEEKKELEKLIQTIKSQKIDEKMAKFLIDTLESNPGNLMIDNKIVKEPELIQKQQELLIKIMSEQIYRENAGDLIQMGTPGWDRFVYHRYWDIFGISRSVLISALMLRSICMHHGENFTNQYGAAILIYLADNLISQPLYYGIRRKLIHQ